MCPSKWLLWGHVSLDLGSILGNPGWPELKVLNWITSEWLFFHVRFCWQNLRDVYLCRTTFNTQWGVEVFIFLQKVKHSFLMASQFPSLLTYKRASLVAQMVKNLPAMQETQFRSLDQKDPLEKGMATLFSILAWWIPWTEEPGKATVHEVAKESDTA